MKLDKLKSKNVILPTLGIIIVSGILLVAAIQLNWFKIGDMTGTIEKNEVSITLGHIDIGTIQSGSSFEASTTISINIPVIEKGGMNVSEFFLIIPESSAGDCNDYMENRFTNFYLNVTMDGLTQTLEVVVNGEFEVPPWQGGTDDEYDNSWYYYWGFSEEIFLPTGANNIEVVSFGLAGVPSEDLNINLGFGIELI